MSSRILKALARAGLDARPVDLTGNRRGVMVQHDYYGLYPDAEAIRKAQQARRVAARLGYESETRGHYTATLIYLN